MEVSIVAVMVTALVLVVVVESGVHSRVLSCFSLLFTVSSDVNSSYITVKS